MANSGNFCDRSVFETLDASFFNDAAERAVRAYCGWHVIPSMEISGTIGSTGSRILRIPAMNVTALTRLVLADGTDVTDFAQWSVDGLVELPFPVPAGIAGIGYTAVAGFDSENAPDVMSVILQVARRAAQAPSGAVRSQSVNGASVSYSFTGDGASAIQLLAPERAILDRYRVVGLP